MSGSEILANAQEILKQRLSQLGLNHSLQRDAVLRIFLAANDHVTTQQLYNLVRQEEPTIGYTTVYRALRLFTQCGLATEVEFRDGIARFEHRLHRSKHHHMICKKCGDSVEFISPEIEEVERRVAKLFQYATTEHIFQIYGLCGTCQHQIGPQDQADRSTNRTGDPQAVSLHA